MIGQIREKNRARLVTAAFRVKFSREPSAAEFIYWVDVYSCSTDLALFLAKLEDAVTSDVPDTKAIFVEMSPKTLVPTTQHLGPLGERGRYFYGLLNRIAATATSKGGN